MLGLTWWFLQKDKQRILFRIVFILSNLLKREKIYKETYFAFKFFLVIATL